jgi:hypothetical protein
LSFSGNLGDFLHIEKRSSANGCGALAFYAGYAIIVHDGFSPYLRKQGGGIVNTDPFGRLCGDMMKEQNRKGEDSNVDLLQDGGRPDAAAFCL